MNRTLLKAMLAVILCFASPASLPQNAPDWLVGTWVLCDDPDQSPKESLQFKADGTGLVIRAKGNIEFLHRLSPTGVSMLANANGYAIPIEMTASNRRDKLLIYSDKTKNTASYVRKDSRIANNCSVK